jgi:large subunit ribosomal protein L15
MRLNDLQPQPGSKRPGKRLGRGVGSGLGKTGGRGHKGQTSRAGGYHKVGFEGGQMPLQRRLPKIGFRSRTASDKDEVRLHELAKVQGDLVDLAALVAAGLVSGEARYVKIIAAGSIDRALTVRGVALTNGARAAVVAAGGKVEE